MAHYNQLKFIELSSQYFDWNNNDALKVLEIGSYDVNGSVRMFFPKNNYCGLDIVEGPGVDLIYDGKKLNFAKSSFDLVLSCEVFEHNPYWKVTLQEMYRVTKPSGYIVITAASKGRQEHGTERTSPKSSPGSLANKWIYYKNIFKSDILEQTQLWDLEFSWVKYNPVSNDIYYIAKKSSNTSSDKKNPFNEAEFNIFIFDVFKREPGTKKYHNVWVYILIDLPISMMSRLLPDHLFQECAYYYQKSIFYIKKKLKKIYSDWL